MLEPSPDLFIVYSGHNEMLRGDTGPYTEMDWLSRVGAGALRWSPAETRRLPDPAFVAVSEARYSANLQAIAHRAALAADGETGR